MAVSLGDVSMLFKLSSAVKEGIAILFTLNANEIQMYNNIGQDQRQYHLKDVNR